MSKKNLAIVFVVSFFLGLGTSELFHLNQKSTVWINTTGVDVGHRMKVGTSLGWSYLPRGVYEVYRDDNGEFHLDLREDCRK